jgi:hypothetical protein
MSCRLYLGVRPAPLKASAKFELVWSDWYMGRRATQLMHLTPILHIIIHSSNAPLWDLATFTF